MKRTMLTLIGCLSALSSGCIIETDGTDITVVRNAYEACNFGDACTNGTQCTAAMYSVTGRPGNLCSVACTSGVQCPPSAYFGAYAPTCVVSVSAGFGLCYDTCVVNGDCGGATTCALVPGTLVRVCVPAT